jgi:hypothetical protein
MKHILSRILFVVISITPLAAMDILQTNNSASFATKAAVFAIEKGSLNALQTALLAGADLGYTTEFGNNFLSLACRYNHEDIALYLIAQPHFQSNTTINQQDCFGSTALHNACARENNKIVQALLDIKGINLDLQEARDNTALHYASTFKHYNTIKLLIRHGANPNVQNCYFATPSAHIFFQNIKSHSSLLKKMAQSVDVHGNTQLHLCATIILHDNMEPNTTALSEYLSSLLYHGVNIFSRNKDNKIAMELAYKKYSELYEQYTKEKVLYFRKTLSLQEQVMHTFLRFYSSHIQHKPVIIASPFAQELNIETVVADKYKEVQQYYDNFAVEFKDNLKQQLRNNPDKVPAIWISEYIPPKIMVDTAPIHTTTSSNDRVPCILTTIN